VKSYKHYQVTESKADCLNGKGFISVHQFGTLSYKGGGRCFAFTFMLLIKLNVFVFN